MCAKIIKSWLWGFVCIYLQENWEAGKLQWQEQKEAEDTVDQFHENRREINLSRKSACDTLTGHFEAAGYLLSEVEDIVSVKWIK